MAEKDEEIEIVLDEKPEINEQAEKPVEKAASAEISPEQGIEELKLQIAEREKALEAEKSARLAAERQAQQFRAETQGSQLDLVKSAISGLERDKSILKSQYAAALREGDFDAAGDIQEKMAEAAAKLLQLENGKRQLETAPRQNPTVDPVEARAQAIAQGGSPRSAEWVRKHPEFARDDASFNRVISAHNYAVAQGHSADSDGYFEAVETALGIRKPAETQRQEAVVEQPRVQERAPVAAPVARSGTGDGSNARTVRLTAEEREIADMLGMEYAEYAKNKASLRKEGRLQ